MKKKQDNIETTRPASYNDTVEKYLNYLRNSNTTNMFSASPNLKQIFGMTSDEARNCLAYWMLSISNR
jgi:hypothetical protein